MKASKTATAIRKRTNQLAQALALAVIKPLAAVQALARLTAIIRALLTKVAFMQAKKALISV